MSSHLKLAELAAEVEVQSEYGQLMKLDAWADM